jgi:predicted nucleotidyltransferase
MDSIARELEEVAARYGVRDVYAFGGRGSEALARVSGRVTPEPAPPSHSDLDLAVQPVAGRELSPRARVRLALELEDLFGGPRVDLVVLSEASRRYRARCSNGCWRRGPARSSRSPLRRAAR